MFALIGVMLILAGWERCAKGGAFNVITGLYAILMGIAAGVSELVPPIPIG